MTQARHQPIALVTGASGFIGPALCERLRTRGWQVRALMRRPVPGPWDTAVSLDLGRQAIPDDLLAGVATVFHLAGKAHAVAERDGADKEYQIANVLGTRDLLAAARRHAVRGFVYFSSVKAEASASEGESAPSAAPLTPYGRSKHDAERLLLSGDGVEQTVVLRPALVYGPNPKGYLAQLIRAMRSGWFPPLPDTGNGRSMIHRDDLADAAIQCASDPRAAGRIFTVTDDIPYSTHHIQMLIRQALGRPEPGWSLPIGLLTLAARGGDRGARLLGRRLPFDSEILEKLTGSALYDGTPLRRELGFRSQRTLQDSIAEMVATTP